MNSNLSIKTLKDVNCPQHIIEHSKTVSKKSLEMASNFKGKTGLNINMELVENGSLLHDIGRSKTHTIKHAIVGAEILRNLNFPVKIINITLNHIGAGIPRNEAKILGLPFINYMPKTFEEKIVAHADNLVNGTVEVDINFVINKWGQKFGKNHPSITRLKKLHNELII